ncbi:MAG: HAMP domain-containing histidine kinase [Coriobacteriales bacterium]|jgi:signal transduction histidine kinase|nr:HAMP domain-containing histidine kinase [Coriobacteriales bacterium]
MGDAFPRLLACLRAAKVWLGVFLLADALFILFAWLAYPAVFVVLVSLMLVLSLLLAAIPVAVSYYRQGRASAAFDTFLLEPEQAHEDILCRTLPATSRPLIRRLGQALRAQQATLNQAKLQLSDYETYIESWVHEIKTPLALMTLLLDNRSDEVSPLVKQRLQHVHDHMREDVENILYFARLGAAHKDYILEPLDLLAACRRAVEEHQALLDEAQLTVKLEGQELRVMCDRRGLGFILSQIIGNSVKYAGGGGRQPLLHFAVQRDLARDMIVLAIRDNGVGVSAADLPFLFDKGFTGETGRGGRATGMGLFLARRMADDLAIGLEAQSEQGEGFTAVLRFPTVQG